MPMDTEKQWSTFKARVESTEYHSSTAISHCSLVCVVCGNSAISHEENRENGGNTIRFCYKVPIFLWRPLPVNTICKAILFYTLRKVNNLERFKGTVLSSSILTDILKNVSLSITDLSKSNLQVIHFALSNTGSRCNSGLKANNMKYLKQLSTITIALSSIDTSRSSAID